MDECQPLVNGTAAPSTDCSGVRARGAVPRFIHFVSMDVEDNEASLLDTWQGLTLVLFSAQLEPFLAQNAP